MITKQENFIRKLIREELDKFNLDNAFNVAMNFFRQQNIISDIFGIGSYFFSKKRKSPNDVDFVIKLNVTLKILNLMCFHQLIKLKNMILTQMKNVNNRFVIQFLL